MQNCHLSTIIFITGYPGIGEVLARWKKRILRALGRNGSLITEVIPEMEWLVGAQPPVETLPPQESQNRFLMVFRNFVRVFARIKHPLVLFLDDLQWADPASLQLIEYLSRDNELSCFSIVTGDWRTAGRRFGK